MGGRRLERVMRRLWRWVSRGRGSGVGEKGGIRVGKGGGENR